MVSFLNERHSQRHCKRSDHRRYHPGYGDLSLEHQRIIFDLLDLDRMGLFF
jgi:hypothetical protein